MLILVHGENFFLSLEKLNEYGSRFKKKHPDGSLSVIDTEESDDSGSLLNNALVSKGLFSAIQLIVVKNSITSSLKNNQDKIFNILKTKKDLIRDKSVVVIFWEKELVKKKDNLSRFLLKNSKNDEFKKLNGSKLTKWIEKKINEYNSNLSISKGALEKLVAYLNNDLHTINNELKKLTSYREQGQVSEDDIDRLVSPKISSTIFHTIEAASGGNKKRALQLLHEQLENKEDPFYILAMYVYQFRSLLKVGELFWNGNSNYSDIARKAGIHPFVVQKTISQLKNFNLPGLKKTYRKVQAIDEKAKTGEAPDIQLALDKFITEL